ncbi:DUF4224 domain-containing protein [Curvibacter sp. RS43]|uniref:DUF4224 domain-containing protein n=1 Tax=Curvibacter microcysteis TaxID=3026419 RepID=UPI002360A4CF|nr:DUF4224 domain-containing protein [Curvibacter sp. RS43]MDD0812970.1 DUF4224 domain-containing protein [Curvibacter sp. RS43]
MTGNELEANLNELILEVGRLRDAVLLKTREPITLQPDELLELTGYRRAGDQLKELKRQGFYRARRSFATGDVILERAHYLSVVEAPRTAGRRSMQPEPELNWSA